VEVDGRARRRGGRVGDALTTIATFTLEARVGSWSELEVYEGSGTLELDVAKGRVTLDHRRPTWRPLTPKRVDLRVLEPLA
jgi:hypothetical protein